MIAAAGSHWLLICHFRRCSKIFPQENAAFLQIQNLCDSEALGTVDYLIEDDVVLRIDKELERDKCVLQFVSYFRSLSYQ